MRALFGNQFVHDLSHQVNASAADSNLGGIEMRYGGQVKRGPLVEDSNFDSVGQKPTLYIQRRRRAIAMRMTDHVTGGFVDGENDRIDGVRLQAAGLTYGLHKQPGHRQ